MDLYDQCHIVSPERLNCGRHASQSSGDCTINQMQTGQKLRNLPMDFTKHLCLMMACILLIGGALAHAQVKDGAQTTDSKPTLFIVGDSPLKNGPRGQMGWGDPIASLFDTSRIRVENRA